MDPKTLDEINCESFFDLVEDFIDFPSENEGLGPAHCKDFPCIFHDTLPLDCPIVPCSGPDLSTELAMPHEDILQLEWLSTFERDSFADGGMTIPKDDNSINKDSSHHQFQTSSPISVLESSSSSSSSSSGGKTLRLSPSHRGPQRARGKRSRPPTFSRHPPVQLILPSPSSEEKHQQLIAPIFSSEPEYFAETHPAEKTNNYDAIEQKKKKKLKLTFTSLSPEVKQNPLAEGVRKCMHCEITKTPQWRAGPMGPKTLCNACGVRYKSGRLLPEYRPAASPTFVPSVHSNSHKKVLEMRNKPVEKGTTPLSLALAPTASQPQL